MKVHLHQTHHKIADFDAIYNYLEEVLKNEKLEGLHIFPELFLSGYPLQDLCLQKNFIDNYHALLSKINSFSKKLKPTNSLLIIGGLEYDLAENNIPAHIRNVAFKLTPGEELETIYTKRLLPNYDIFDEEKYFTQGDESTVIKAFNKNIGIMICEDMWPSCSYSIDPSIELKKHCEKQKISLDLVVNLSASPFNIGKANKRVARAVEISSNLTAPFIYLNRVGGEDEILFDGNSFVVAGSKVITQGKLFQQDLISIDFPEKPTQIEDPQKNKGNPNSWESLFQAQVDNAQTPPVLATWNSADCEMILQAIRFGVQEYAAKSGFKKFLVASSGGIDSALVLAIIRLILNKDQTAEALFMPGFFSSSISYDLSFQLAKNLGIKQHTVPIKFFHSAIKNAYRESYGSELEGLANENIQSRLRGSLLYARSNSTGAMVINTSNKSELAVGYSTLYGDSVGAISILGDLYKTDVFRLANYINEKYDNIIPQEIIDRPPSAELKEDQQDSDSLPPYERLDPMLEGLLSFRLSPQDLIAQGFDKEEVEKVYRLYTNSEFKRFQFCPIIKLRPKSFGFGYRIPICKKA